MVPYPVLTEKQGEVVAQFKMTIMITKGKTTALTGLPLNEAEFKADHELKNQNVLDLLSVNNVLLSYQWTRQSRRKRRRKSKLLDSDHTLTIYALIIVKGGDG